MDLHYLQIPYELHGRTFDGADCYGLVYLYLNNKGYTLPKYEISYTLDTAKDIIAQEYSNVLGDSVSMEDDAIVLFYRGNIPTHIGVVSGDNILHTSKMRGVVCESYKSILRRYTKVEFYRVNKNYQPKEPIQ